MIKIGASALLCGCFLISCGGGSNDGSAQSNPGATSTVPVIVSVDKAVTGAWEGTIFPKFVSTSPFPMGPAAMTVVTQNGNFWMLHGDTVENSLEVMRPEPSRQGFVSIEGVVYGTISAVDKVLKGVALGGFSNNLIASQISLEGAFSPIEMTATLSGDNFEQKTLKLQPVPNSYYTFSDSPRITDLLGSWSGKEIVGNASATSNLTLSKTSLQRTDIAIYAGECAVAGELTPRASSSVLENLFDAKLKTGPFCSTRSNKEFTGIVFLHRLANRRSQIVLLANTQDRLFALVFWAIK